MRATEGQRSNCYTPPVISVVSLLTCLAMCPTILTAQEKPGSDLYAQARSLPLGKDGVITTEALTLLEKASKAGHVDAHLLLGVAHYAGNTPTGRSMSQAATAFERAALAGSPDGLYFLGLVKAQGEGDANDPVAARRYYAKAAEQGHQLAQFTLGLMLTAGTGGPRNRIAAGRWFERAAQGPDADLAASARRAVSEVQKYIGETEAMGILGWVSTTLVFAAAAVSLLPATPGEVDTSAFDRIQRQAEVSSKCARRAMMTSSPAYYQALCMSVNQ